MQGTVEEYEKVKPKFLIPYMISSLNTYFPKMIWSDDDVILDIGCGPGTATKNILLPKCSKLKKIVAIDVASEYIDFAKTNSSHEKIEYKTQNIMEKLESNEKFDKIVSFYALQYIHDFEKLFSNLSSILKPGGYFLFLFFSKHPLFYIMRELSENEEWKKHIKRKNILKACPPIMDWKDTEIEFKNLVSKFDLEIKESKCENVDLPYPSKTIMMDLLLAVCPAAVFEHVEPEVISYLWKHAEDIMFKHGLYEKNNEFLVPVEVMHVFGQKRNVWSNIV